jgi:hypothetical protein
MHYDDREPLFTIEKARATMELRHNQEKLLQDIKVVVADVKERIHDYEEYKNSLIDPEP